MMSGDFSRLTRLVERLNVVQNDIHRAREAGEDEKHQGLQVCRWKICGEIEDEVHPYVYGIQPPPHEAAPPPTPWPGSNPNKVNWAEMEFEERRLRGGGNG